MLSLLLTIAGEDRLHGCPDGEHAARQHVVRLPSHSHLTGKHHIDGRKSINIQISCVSERNKNILVGWFRFRHFEEKRYKI
jgi:hypothetical protein